MTDAVKLLTEAEARGAWNATFHLHAKSFDEYCADLRERGLIAPEPDPLLIEAREIVAAVTGVGKTPLRQGNYDSGYYVELALAALKRGMEMRPPLTREMVREALRQCRWSDDDHFVDRFLAALTKDQS